MIKDRTGCGLLFDIDGTLAETDHLHMRAFNDVMAQFNVCLDDDGYKRQVMGRTNAAIFADLLPNHPKSMQLRIADAKEAAFRALAGRAIEPAKGLLALLDWAERTGIACACVTNAPRPNAELILRGLKLDKRFPVLVLADDLAHGKPHPLPYLTGAARIGAEPARSVAFEDSRSGVQSAAAAGIATVGIMSGLDEAALMAAGARLAVRDFTDQRLMPFIVANIG
jgi:HAD superfamily hydrolase (TIGR01509 family)